MNKFISGLTIGGLLILLNICPAYSNTLDVKGTSKKQDISAEVLIDTVVEISNFKKKSRVLMPTMDALTLSRFEQDGQVHTMAVLEDDGESIIGIDLSVALGRYEQHTFDVIRGMSYESIAAVIQHSPEEVTVKYENLLPSVAGTHHLAIGINYADHGKETGQIHPFMFPKYVATDAAMHKLQYTKGWLLDHEVELGIVFPSPVGSVEELNHIMIGFLVVNDFTDRATLMRKIDSKNVTGGKGFPEAKSKRGFLPTGPYLVIPRHWRTFANELHLTLTVNGEVRQQGSAKDMVWNIDKIVEQSLLVKGQKTGYYGEERVPLFEGNCIPANSILITGTPAGVVFNAPSSGFVMGSVTKYIFTGGFFSKKMHSYIVQQYLQKEMSNQRYLKPGDCVESSVSYLGTIRTNVQE